jgi:hypothetical protein
VLTSDRSALPRGLLVGSDLFHQPLRRLLVRGNCALLCQAGFERIHQIDDLGLRRRRLGGYLLAFNLGLNGLQNALADGVVIVLRPELISSRLLDQLFG